MTFVPSVLAGKRILIVEDEAMIAFLIEEHLMDFKCIPVGPFNSVAKALEAVQSEVFDVALLDVLLGGEKVYPVADALAERNIPFLFLSGYGARANPPGHSERKICSKPFKAEDLAASLAAVLAEAALPPETGFGVASLDRGS
jgi:DNA-binding NtrC family response regulator